MRYRAPGERPDENAAEHFLVDGVPPAVIGEGPPEFGAPEPDLDEGRPREARYEPPPRRREPPTDQIPVIHQLPGEQPRPEKKSLLARVFRLR